MENVVVKDYMFDNYIWSNDVVKHTTMDGPTILYQQTVVVQDTKPKEIKDIEWREGDDNGTEEELVKEVAPSSTSQTPAPTRSVRPAVRVRVLTS
jgi:hypothetical protein